MIISELYIEIMSKNSDIHKNKYHIKFLFTVQNQIMVYI